MSESSIAALPKFDSIKRIIRRQKSCTENFDNTVSAGEIIIPERYTMSLKGQPCILYDSVTHDTNRLLIFGTRQMLSLLRDTSSWYADGTFKVVLSQFSSYTQYIGERWVQYTLGICTYVK